LLISGGFIIVLLGEGWKPARAIRHGLKSRRWLSQPMGAMRLPRGLAVVLFLFHTGWLGNWQKFQYIARMVSARSREGL
jgi:hypothetical protein